MIVTLWEDVAFVFHMVLLPTKAVYTTLPFRNVLVVMSPSLVPGIVVQLFAAYFED